MADIAFEKDLAVAETGIGGLKVVDLAVHGDSRGWFKENWQRAKMTALGIPDFRVVQNNVSYNEKRGVTRGIHAEPWDKFISVARGSVFGAWVDLREGSATYGKVFTCTLDPSRAIYVPRGVGNSFQALEDGTAYTYLVDAHWSLELKKTYTFVNLADPELAIQWPIPLDEATVSEADLNHPMLMDVVPMAPKRTRSWTSSGRFRWRSPSAPRPICTTRCSRTSSRWRPRGPSSPAATASWAMRCVRSPRSAAWRRTSTSATSTPSTCPTRRPTISTTGRSTAP